ncbi:MAG: amidohydrolase family protein, partial [Candidatus Hydrogenedentota bacterium]
HVHLGQEMAYALPVFVAEGVTHVRDMGSVFEETNALREDIAQGGRVGPMIRTSGPILESAQFVARLAKTMSAEELETRVPVASPEEAAPAVAGLAAMGVDFLKIRTVGSREIYLAIAKAAREHHLALVGHAPPPTISILEAAAAGQASFEHYIDSPGIKPLPDDHVAAIKQFVKFGTHFVPTLVSGVGFRLTPDEEVRAALADTEGTKDPRRKYVSAKLVHFWTQQMDMKAQEQVKPDYAGIHRRNAALFLQMHDAGVRLMTGTDLGGPLVYPGFGVHDELALFVSDIGLTPAQALDAATRVPAEFSGQGDTYGLIKSGFAADFLLVEKNPLDDIHNTSAIKGVFANGKWIDRAEADKLLEIAAREAAKLE